MILPIWAADPVLRGWEGGISGRGGACITATSSAGANPNCEAKSGVRDTNLTAKVIVWVTAKVTKSTINLAVRLDVTFNVRSTGGMGTGTDQDIPDTFWSRPLSG